MIQKRYRRTFINLEHDLEDRVATVNPSYVLKERIKGSKLEHCMLLSHFKARTIMTTLGIYVFRDMI